MTAADLIKAFETLAEAPDGVARLRELVLQLAVRGRLVPQDPKDEPAGMLLERIAAEKARLVRKKKIRVPRGLLPLSEARKPFDLPRGWDWCRFTDVGELARGRSKHRPRNDPTLYSGGDIPMVQTGDVARSNGTVETYTALYNEAGLAQSRLWPAGTMCITIAANIADTAMLGFDACFPDSVVGFRPFPPLEAAQYFEYFMRTAQQDLEAFAPSTAQKNINLAILDELLIPIPPLAEQHRIVARVDELMGLLDRLEAARKARNTTRAAARDAALAALREAGTPEEVEVAWNRLAERLDDLLTDPADIEPLRQTVLQLAVRGRLVRQEPGDEPASVLLERIAEEKAWLVREGVIPKSKAAPAIVEDEITLGAPSSWLWTRMINLTTLITSGSRNWNQFYSASGASFIRSQDIKEDRLFYDNRIFVSLPAGAEGKRTRVKDGDLLITITGANVGKCAHISEDPGEAYVSQHVGLMCPVDKSLSRFLHVWLTGEFSGRGLLLGGSYGAKPGLNLTQLRELLVPLPPLPEQHRIVAKVDQLMAIIDRLAKRLTATRDTQGTFAAAAVHHLEA